MSEKDRDDRPPMNFLNTKSRNQRGAVAVELAFIFPILAMLLFGIIEFGLFFSRLQVYQGAAREGARLAAVHADVDDVQTRVTEAAEPFTVTGPVTVAVEGGGSECTGSTTGDQVKVSWEQGFEDAIVLPFIPDISFSSNISGVFRCE